MMRINNKEFDFSITNLDDGKRFEEAIASMEKNEKTVKEMAELVRQGKAKLYNLMETQMQMFRAFFIECTGQDLLEDVRDLTVTKSEYNKFIQLLQEQIASYTNDMTLQATTPVVKDILSSIRNV